MASERFQRRIDRLVDTVEEATDQRDRQKVHQLAEDVLVLDPDNSDATNFLAAAQRGLSSSEPPASRSPITVLSTPPTPSQPTSFANGRYQFTPALIPETLTRGGRLHAIIAKSLEKLYGADPRDAQQQMVEWDPEDPDPSVIQGDLADSWEILDDGKTDIFHLNKQARWHDGVPVSAEEVVFSMDAMVCADCFEVLKGQRRSSTIFFKIAYEAGMSRAIDEKTVEINLKFPVPAFLDMLSLSSIGIAPRHTVIDQGKVQHIYKSEDLNGSGPFKHLGYTADVKNEYEKNTDYWKEGLPRIDPMTHFIITDPGTLVAAFKSGQVLMKNQPTIPLNPLQAMKLGEDMAGELTVLWGGPSGMRGFQINTKKPPFNDVRVRRALHLAVHRQPVIDIISGGMHLLGTPLPPDIWYSYTSEEAAQMPGYRELNGEKHPDDLAEARRLLAEAGLPAEGMKVELATRDAVGYPDIAAIIAAQLRRDLGWDITLKVYESAAGYAEYKVGNFQFNFQGSSYNFEDPDAALARYALGGTASRRAAGGDIEGWVAPGFQELFEAQAAEQDREKRIELVLKAHDVLLNEDNAYVGVFWSMRHWPVSNRIQNLNMHPSAYATHKLERIWCEPKC